MNSLKANKNFYIIAGFIAIAVVFVAYNFLLAYASYANEIPRKLRHVNRLVFSLLIFGIGYFAFKKNNIQWLTDTWKIIYVSIITILIFAGLYDWTISQLTFQVRSIVKNLNEFLISPLPFIALFAISKNFSKFNN